MDVAEQRSQEPDPGDRGHGALEPADGELVRRRARRAGCRGKAPRWRCRSPGSSSGFPRSGLSIEQLVQIGNAGTGRRPGLDQQHDRQPALPGLDGLARVRRDDERRRAEAARGSGRTLRQDGFRDARSLPARRRGDREGQPPVRKRRGAQGDPARARRHRRARRHGAATTIARRTSASIWSTRAGRALERAAQMRASPVRCAVQDRARAPLLLLPRARSRLITVTLTAIAAGEGASRRRRRRRARRARRPAAAGGEPARGRDGELAGDVARDAAPVAANGLLAGTSVRSRARWSWSRRCSPAPRASTGLIEALEVRFLANRDDHLHFAPADRFRRRAPRKRCPRTSRCSRRARGIEELNEKYGLRGRRCESGDRRHVLPVSPTAPLESSEERVWMGYERKRGKACGPERVPARRRERDRFSLIVGETARAVEREVRDHARHRHAAAARRRRGSSSA